MVENCCFSRRYFVAQFSSVFIGLCSFNVESATIKEIPTAKSLQNEILLAQKISSPLLVLVSLDNCPFCKVARDNYLLPLMTEQSMPIVQVNFRHQTSVVDAQGLVLSQDQLIRKWGVKVAPTVLFLGSEGKEIAPRLVGGSTSDFYGVYLDERIRIAQNAVARGAGMK